jgi:hypothetical protein
MNTLHPMIDIIDEQRALREVEDARHRDARNEVVVECARWLAARGLREDAKAMLKAML